jgi:alpha-L-arabinofuranosidase
LDGKKIPAVSLSASQDSTGKIHISIVNLDPHQRVDLSANLKGLKWTKVTGQILTSENLTDINTFDQPHKLQLKPFNSAIKDGDQLVVDMPAKSVVTLELN